MHNEVIPAFMLVRPEMEAPVRERIINIIRPPTLHLIETLLCINNMRFCLNVLQWLI